MSSSSQLFLGDLFAELYDGVHSTEIFHDAIAADEHLCSRDGQETTDTAHQLALEDDPDLSTLRSLAADHGELSTLGVLRGLDRAFASASPLTDCSERPALDHLRAYNLRKGRLDSGGLDGAVVLRRVQPGRRTVHPDSLAAAFVNTLRIAERDWKHVSFVRAPRGLDFDEEDVTPPVVLACAPVVETLAEHEIRPLPDDPPHTGYAITIRETGAIRARITDLLANLDDSRAALAVMPEMTLSPNLLGFWQELALTTERDPSARKQWLLVGTGPVREPAEARPRNRAVIIDRDSGVEIVRQDKLHGFTLARRQIQDWGLEDQGLPPQRLDEAIVTGRRMHVLESRLGRIAILICEDLGRLGDLLRVIRAVGASHILTPVFADVTRAYFWEHQKAREFAGEVGSHVVVSNSLAVRDHRARTGTLPPNTGSSVYVSPSGYCMKLSTDGASAVAFETADDDDDDV